MANAREVVIVNGARTAIGDYGGSLKDIPPTELGARVVREAVARSGVDPAQIGQCVFGNVIHTEAKDMYLSRVAAISGVRPTSKSGCVWLSRARHCSEYEPTTPSNRRAATSLPERFAARRRRSGPIRSFHS